MDIRKTKRDAKVDKNPYDRREEARTKKAFKSVEKSVAPVAKDTNKTRRAETKSRKIVEKAPTIKPRASLHKALEKLSGGKR